jgi:predicted nucleotidyltransferase
MRSQKRALARAVAFAKKARARASSLGLDFVGAYLVGSRARGDYLVDSDVDLILVLRGVKGLDPIERLRLFSDVLEPGLELRVYDFEEWEGGDSAWMKRLKEEAVELAMD